MNSSDYLLNLSDSLFQYRENSFLCDTVLVAADQKKFYSHSIFLAAASAKLRQKFENLNIASVKHNYLFQVHVEDCIASDIQKLLQYIYTGSILLVEEMAPQDIRNTCLTGEKMGLDEDKVSGCFEGMLRLSGAKDQTWIPSVFQHEVEVEIIPRGAELIEGQDKNSVIQSCAGGTVGCVETELKTGLEGASTSEGSDSKKRKASLLVEKNWNEEEKDIYNLLSDAEELLRFCSGRNELWNLLEITIGKGLLLYTNPDEDGSCLTEMLESFSFFIKDAKGITTVKKLEDFLNYGLSKKCAGFVFKEVENASDGIREGLVKAVEKVLVTGFPGFVIVTSRNLHVLSQEFRDHFGVYYGWV